MARRSSEVYSTSGGRSCLSSSPARTASALPLSSYVHPTGAIGWTHSIRSPCRIQNQGADEFSTSARFVS